MKKRKKEEAFEGEEAPEDFEAFEEWEEGEGEEVPEEEEEFAEEEPVEEAPEEEPEPEPEPGPEPEEKPKAPEKFSKAALDLTPDVPVQVIAVMGKRGITIKELMELRMGQVIDLKRPPNETVDIVVHGRLFARGELVEIDGKLGVKIIKLVK